MVGLTSHPGPGVLHHAPLNRRDDLAGEPGSLRHVGGKVARLVGCGLLFEALEAPTGDAIIVYPLLWARQPDNVDVRPALGEPLGEAHGRLSYAPFVSKVGVKADINLATLKRDGIPVG